MQLNMFNGLSNRTFLPFMGISNRDLLFRKKIAKVCKLPLLLIEHLGGEKR